MGADGVLPKVYVWKVRAANLLAAGCFGYEQPADRSIKEESLTLHVLLLIAK